MILGHYDHDLEWPLIKEGDAEDPATALRHHKQFYANGTKCDLTGDLRKTEVRVRMLHLFGSLLVALFFM